MHPIRRATTRRFTLIVLMLSTVILTSAGSCSPTDDGDPGATPAPTTAQQQPGPTDSDDRGNDRGNPGGGRTPDGDTSSDGRGG